MAILPWNLPSWTRTVPGVAFDEEARLLEGFVKAAPASGFRVIPEKQLDFDTRGYADLVLEREDGARLLFALSERAPYQVARVDINARPRARHVELRQIDGEWRLVTGSRILDPRRGEDLNLPGLVEILLDSGL